jgi:hypothetical protein
MRPVMFVALLGTTLSVNLAPGQSSPDQPASATAAPAKKKHSGTSGTDALTENAPDRPTAILDARRAAAQHTSEAESAPEAAPVTAPKPPALPAYPLVQAVPPGPPLKNLTGEEFAQIHVGSAEKEVLTVLGPPTSKIVVPDDGHLRETLQYWVKGSPMGTVRLDNGRVVQIETKGK